MGLELLGRFLRLKVSDEVVNLLETADKMTLLLDVSVLLLVDLVHSLVDLLAQLNLDFLSVKALNLRVDQSQSFLLLLAHVRLRALA